MLREFFLLSAGEQRGLVMVSTLLILSLVFRMLIAALPERKPEGMEQFRAELRERNTGNTFGLYPDSLSRRDTLLEGENILFGTDFQGNITRKRRAYRVENPKARVPVVELNSADSAALLPLPGIGPVFAGRIVKYRQLLGGYVCPDQILEVYGMDSLRYRPLTPFLRTDTTLLSKLDPNTADFRDLLRHPYLEYENVLALVRYREMLGPLDSLGEIRRNFLLPDSTLEKIRPYLELANK